MLMFPVLRRLAAALLAAALVPVAGVAEEATAVFVARAYRGAFADRIEALGTLRANESVTLSATLTERISALHFDDGDRVAAGQPLVELVSTEEQALRTEAQSTVDEARRQLRRVESLAAEGAASKSLLDERRRESETARARLAAIEARLDERIVRAPFAGVLGLRQVSVGTLLSPGTPIVTLDDDATLKLDFTVPSVFLSVLRPGLALGATSAAFPGRPFTGVVAAIDSRIDPVTRAVTVRARVPNPERLLRPGMLMQVTLGTQPREATLIPEKALMPLGQSQSVLVVGADGTVERRAIQIGTRRPGEVEVLEGLVPGERVVTDGTQKLRPGDPVRILAVDDGDASLPERLERAGQ
ncbi:MAG: efflux RND transporter periplasmic adaptor subunit [Gammaproteobacteria bacterium]